MPEQGSAGSTRGLWPVPGPVYVTLRGRVTYPKLMRAGGERRTQAGSGRCESWAGCLAGPSGGVLGKARSPGERSAGQQERCCSLGSEQLNGM